VVPGALLLLWIWWHVSVKNWFKGPKTTVDLPTGVSGAEEIALEHHGGTAHSQQAAQQPVKAPEPEH
jgi:hypothetical protein